MVNLVFGKHFLRRHDRSNVTKRMTSGDRSRGYLRSYWYWIGLGALGAVVFGACYWSLTNIPGMNGTKGKGPSLDGTTKPSESDDDGSPPFDISIETTTDVNSRTVPLPLRCNAEDMTFVFDDESERFCRWNDTLEECYNMMVPEFEDQPSWVFLGDSGMAHLAYYFSLRSPIKWEKITSRRNGCQNLNYYRFPPPDHGWVQPNVSLGEGPIGYGKDHPYCTDCRKCWNVLFESPTPKSTNSQSQGGVAGLRNNQQEEPYIDKEQERRNKRFFEYLVVEYARDVSLPTRSTNTTQQTATYYLSGKNPDVCVVNAGLHDATIDPPVTTQTYVTNVDNYLRLLTAACKYVVWIGIPAVLESSSYPHIRNCRLHAWNSAVFALIQSRGYENVYIIDIWNKTMQTDHDGPLVLTSMFYSSMSRLLVQFIAGLDV